MWLERQWLFSYPVGLWGLVEEKKREWGPNKGRGEGRGEKQRTFLENKEQKNTIKSSKLASQFLPPPAQTLSSIRESMTSAEEMRTVYYSHKLHRERELFLGSFIWDSGLLLLKWRC